MMSMKGIIIDKDGTLFNYAYVWGGVVSKAIRGGFSELGLKGDKLNRITMRFEELFGIDERGGSYKNGILFRPDLAVITIAKMVLASLGAGLNPFKVKNKVFDKIYLSEEVGYEKPAKEFFDRVFEDIDVDKRHVMIVGDSITSDMKGGIDYGIKTCHYDPKGRCCSLPVTYSIGDLRELIYLL